MRLLSALGVLVLFSGCDVRGEGCESFLYTGATVFVTVRDSETREPLREGVAVTANVGEYSETLRPFDSGEVPQFYGVFVPSPGLSSDMIVNAEYEISVVGERYEAFTTPVELETDATCLGRPYPTGPEEVEVLLTATSSPKR